MFSASMREPQSPPYTGETFQVASWSPLMWRYYLLSALQNGESTRAQSFVHLSVFISSILLSHWGGAGPLWPSPQCSSCQSWGTSLRQVRPLLSAPPPFHFWWRTPVQTQGQQQRDDKNICTKKVPGFLFIDFDSISPWPSSPPHLLPRPPHLRCLHTSHSEPHWAWKTPPGPSHLRHLREPGSRKRQTDD